MFAKTGPRTKRKLRLPVAGSWSMISVPVMSLGIRSGVNWMRMKFRCSAWANVETVERLGQPRHADGEAVAAGEDADQHLLDHLVLADDHLVDLAQQRFPASDPADGFLGGDLWRRWGHGPLGPRVIPARRGRSPNCPPHRARRRAGTGGRERRRAGNHRRRGQPARSRRGRGRGSGRSAAVRGHRPARIPRTPAVK